MNRNKTITGISDDIINKLRMCISYNCDMGFKHESRATITKDGGVASFQYTIITNSPKGYMNRKINNPNPSIYKNFIRFTNISIDDTNRGNGIFTEIIKKIEEVCDDLRCTIIISEFQNQKLAYNLGTKRNYLLFTGNGYATNLKLLKSYINDTNGKANNIFFFMTRKKVPLETAEYAVRFPRI